MLHILWNLVAFIITFSILTTIHEFGHFLAAKYCNVLVERFSIGFGKTVWRYSKNNGTEFAISIIPLGGYIKMLDERIDYVSSEKKKYTFNNKTVSQRMAIVAAGPIANFILSILIYWIIFIIGIPTVRPVVSAVIPNSIAAKSKIIPGIEFKSIDNIKTFDWDSIRLQLLTKVGHNNITIGFVKPGSNEQEYKILDLSNWNFELGKEDPVITLGIIPNNVKIEPILTQVQEYSTASKAGLKIGDKIIRVNGKPLTQWISLNNLVHSNPGKVINLDVERKGKVFSLNLKIDSKFQYKKTEGFIGIVPKIISLSNNYRVIYRYKFFDAITEALNKTFQIIKLMILMVYKLITNDLRLNNFSGPIAIARGAGISARMGIIFYFMFIAIISINLGVINLLPIPILDGGHLFFLLIEKLTGNPISEKVQDISHRISLIILIILMIVAFLNDLSRF